MIIGVLNKVTQLALDVDRKQDQKDFISLVSELANLESYNRHLYRPGAYMHKWWARRCGTTFRAILKYLEDPENVDFYRPDGLKGKTVLDPMMGGGTTVYEACRLEANVIGIDIDPVSSLLVKAGLNDVDENQLKEVFLPFFQNIRDNVKQHWDTYCKSCGNPKEAKFRLLARKVVCECEEEIFQVDNHLLYERKDDPDILLCKFCGEVHREGYHSCNQATVQFVEKDKNNCPNCNAEFTKKIDVPFHERYKYMAERLDCDCGVIFQSFNKSQSIDRKKLRKDFQRSFFEIESGEKSDALLNRNIKSFLETFSDPQLAFYNAALHEFRELDDELKYPIAMLLSTSTEFNNLLCGYKGQGVRRPGAVRHVFAHHAYSIPWVSLENNPVLDEKSSGNLKLIFEDRIVRGIKWRRNPRERDIFNGGWRNIAEDQVADLKNNLEDMVADETGKSAYITQSESASIKIPEKSIDFIVTDPPYYDSVQYSDLSQFFRGWLETYLPNEADWEFETSQNLAFKSLNGPESFGKNLGNVLSSAVKGLKPDGKVAFTYHHWAPEAWSALTIACLRANLFLKEFLVVKAENSQSVHITGVKALEHDAILIFQPDDGEGKDPSGSELVDFSNSEKFVWECANHLGQILNYREVNKYESLKKNWEEKLGNIKDSLQEK